MEVCNSFLRRRKNKFLFFCSARDDPQSLVILLNEEIVVIDLITDSWPSYHLPYLNSIHASPVICTAFACNINQDFFQKLTNYASIQFEDYSDRVCSMNFIVILIELIVLFLEMANYRWRNQTNRT
jgi:hypothetical protein